MQHCCCHRSYGTNCLCVIHCLTLLTFLSSLGRLAGGRGGGPAPARLPHAPRDRSRPVPVRSAHCLAGAADHALHATCHGIRLGAGRECELHAYHTAPTLPVTSWFSRSSSAPFHVSSHHGCPFGLPGAVAATHPAPARTCNTSCRRASTIPGNAATPPHGACSHVLCVNSRIPSLFSSVRGCVGACAPCWTRGGPQRACVAQQQKACLRRMMQLRPARAAVSPMQHA